MTTDTSPKSTHLYVVAFTHESRFLVSKEAALAIMDALGDAEKLITNYGRDDEIKPIDQNAFTLNPYSREKYLYLKSSQPTLPFLD